jgi:hypothetical protein
MTAKAARIKASRHILSAPPVKTPQQAASEVIQGDKPLCTAGKEAIAAFYLKLARSQPYSTDELKAALRWLGIVRLVFMRGYGLTEHHTSEDRGVPEAPGWLGECIADQRFPPLREKFEQMTQDHLLGYVGKMFKNDLIDWLDKAGKLRKAEALAYRRTEDGKFRSNLTGKFIPKGNIIPDYTEPETEVSRIASKAKVKTGAFAEYVQSLKDNPNNENKAKLRMIKETLEWRARLRREDPEALKRWLAECRKSIGGKLKIVDGVPVNKTKTYLWAGHQQKPRKRKS